MTDAADRAAEEAARVAEAEAALAALKREAEDAAAAHEAAAQQAQDAAKAQAEYDKMQRGFERQQKASRPKAAPAPRAKKETNPVTDFLGSSQGQSIVRSVVSGIFGTLKRR